MSQAIINAIYKFKDTLTDSLVKIDAVHSKIHSGKHFTSGHILTSVANNGNLDIRITTGAKYAHIVGDFIASGKANVTAYEGGTLSDGTLLSAVNNNRNSANTATAAVKHTPTVTAAGNVILPTTLIPGSTGGSAKGDNGTLRNEFILKPNTEYLVRLTNTAGTAQDLNIILTWYEE